MVIRQDNAVHERYLRTRRHWCPDSEPYTGTDSLLTALNEGWQPVNMVYREQVMLERSRYTVVYHFGLRRQMSFRQMTIVSNPYLERLIREEKLNVLVKREQQIDFEPMPVAALA